MVRAILYIPDIPGSENYRRVFPEHIEYLQTYYQLANMTNPKKEDLDKTNYKALYILVIAANIIYVLIFLYVKIKNQ